ncbi:MAG: hypothetical protein U1E67_02320, partial [Hyphomicrobiales bacterium]
MANISGTAQRDKITPAGRYSWNGVTWVLVSSAGTTSSSDTVNAGGDNDEVDGGGGNDVINGQAGNDLLVGGAGSDTIDGGNDNDTIYGGSAVLNSTASGDDT